MKLISIDIHNYKSIEHINIPINEINGSYTYTLVGVNEAGKSAILSAIAMLDNFSDFKLKFEDFHNGAEKIEVFLNYEIDLEILKDEPDFKDNIISTGFEVLKTNPHSKVIIFKYNSKLGKQKSEVITQQNDKYGFLKKRHKVVFWKYDSKYLLDKEIIISSNNYSNNINQNISLKNCFQIAKIELNEFQKNISNSIEREDYQDKLSKSINTLIKLRWPNQNIEVKFNLTETKINFHIKDSNAKSQKINQRSDGFRQFLSFLLSIAAENESDNLSNTIILLDEPETHLHPQAQKFFLEEIINMTKTKNNILFYSTHSGFLIDKNNIERTAKVSKNEELQNTEFHFLGKENYSFARVNYEIFEAEAEGYHNELYGLFTLKINEHRTEEIEKEIKRLKSEIPIKTYNQLPNNKKHKYTLVTYIRHQIHHPENETNQRFTDQEIKESIKFLIELIKLKSYDEK